MAEGHHHDSSHSIRSGKVVTLTFFDKSKIQKAIGELGLCTASRDQTGTKQLEIQFSDKCTYRQIDRTSPGLELRLCN